MNITILLAQILGIYVTTISLVFLFKPHHSVIRLFHDFETDSALMYVVGVLELLFGLFLVLGYGIWSGWGLLITLAGLLMVIEAVVFLLSPHRYMKFVFKWFVERKSIYYLFTVATLILGVLLLYVGFMG